MNFAAVNSFQRKIAVFYAFFYTVEKIDFTDSIDRLRENH